MADNQIRVLNTQDLPDSAANNPTSSTSAADATQVAVAAGFVRNVDNVFFTNRFTRFESLVFEITGGFAASQKGFKSDEDFAKQACDLARAIAFEMAKYQAT